MHTVMQHIPLTHVPTAEEAERTVRMLYEKELLTEEQQEAIDIEEIVRFFGTEIGKDLLGALRIDREVPFSMALPADEVYKDAETAR